MDASPIKKYIENRANELGLSLSEVCRRANISRQTLYSLTQGAKLPALKTIVGLAGVLEVHPLHLLQLVFDEVPMKQLIRQRQTRTDQNAFIQETIPHGTLVLCGQRFTKTWEMQNTGSVPWKDRYLQCMDEEIVVFTRTGEPMPIAGNLIPDVQRIAVPYTAPGAVVKLSVAFTAPAIPGTFISYWKSVFEDGSLCFPEELGLSVKVRVNTLAIGAVLIS